MLTPYTLLYHSCADTIYTIIPQCWHHIHYYTTAMMTPYKLLYHSSADSIYTVMPQLCWHHIHYNTTAVLTTYKLLYHSSADTINTVIPQLCWHHIHCYTTSMLTPYTLLYHSCADIMNLTVHRTTTGTNLPTQSEQLPGQGCSFTLRAPAAQLPASSPDCTGVTYLSAYFSTVFCPEGDSTIFKPLTDW